MPFNCKPNITYRRKKKKQIDLDLDKITITERE